MRVQWNAWNWGVPARERAALDEQRLGVGLGQHVGAELLGALREPAAVTGRPKLPPRR